MTLLSFFRFLHRWAGLVTGPFVFIIALTGALYAFQTEILDLIHPGRFLAGDPGPERPPSELAGMATRTFPDVTLHAIQYDYTGRAAEAIFYQPEPLAYFIVYMNPVSGTIQSVLDMESGFFPFILKGHFYLWLPPEIGQPLAASVTLVFIFVVLIGLFLWFPRQRSVWSKRFWFRWKEKVSDKRKIWDLHAITGFYVASFALLFSATGLVWGFTWFAGWWYGLAGGEKSTDYTEPAPVISSQSHPPDTQPAIDRAWAMLKQSEPMAQSIEVHPPHSDSSVIVANVNYLRGTWWKVDYRYLDPVTLADLPVTHVWGRLKDAGTADLIYRMNYDIHTGAVLGFPGKMLAFLASLLIASMPVTGCWIWWRKRRRTPNRH